jgi:repressor LexA
LLKIRGMSMKDIGMLDGDLLAVKHAKDAKNGQIVVARIGDEVTVKRFRRSGDLIELIPENNDFSTIKVEINQAFEIEGLAVGLIRTSVFH